ncbi:non-ribosomal peptide synthetase [Bailinhaonella thermotolerans]|uniref:Amino acid adenylation domain-containing protein n=1 Tax=Bailinhaonella thermotolerans TaxID=1070861 RepID=A0A3A4BC74_9ACTN|nr:non-ribosomal peptide synthetase [Bailinhaonella thermotolerans]RJL31788.1 amino acid adenylation domain-containing protein [Bailinhaonella thermotolerans]
MTGAPEDQDVFPVSSGQERMWFMSRFEPDLAVYNIQFWLPIDRPDLVETALAGLVRRHEALRTTLELRESGVVQVVHRSVPITVARDDLSGRADADAEFRRLAQEYAARPFELAAPPLWRMRLVRTDADGWRLICVFDHSIFDGLSVGIFMTELDEFLLAAAEGRGPDLPEPAVQYADYAVWQRERLTPEFVERELEYWRGRLAGIPDDTGIPTDRPRPPVRTYGGAHHVFSLEPELHERVEELAQRSGATTFMVLLAAYKVLLARWSGRYDVVVACPVAGRPVPEVEPLIGMFVNALVLRTDLSGEPGFAGALERVSRTLLEGLDHQELPFERLVEALAPVRDPSRPPLFQAQFNLVPGEAAGSLTNGTAKLDLSLELNVQRGRMYGRIEYATDLFEPGTIARFAEAYVRLLEAAVADPARPITDLPLFGPEERERVLTAWNGTDAPLAEPEALHRLVEEQARRTLDAVAVCGEHETLTYAELDDRANRLAAWLGRLRAGPETPVAVCAERSPDLVVALLAVLKAGAFYVPLDPGYPRARLAHMLEDSRARVLLTQSVLASALPRGAARTVLLDREADWAGSAGSGSGGGAGSGAGADVSPHNAAYAIYTSGSTGLPKGAVISHRAIVNRLRWTQRAYGLGPGDAVLQKTPVSFDVSVWEFFWPLITGARLVLAPPGAHRDPAALRDVIVKHDVTTVHFVPSMLEEFLAGARVEDCASLRRVLCSGEELPARLARRLAERLPGAEVHNLYGPTEAAVDVSHWACHATVGERVPIGHPVDNTRLHVLDERLEPVPVGVPGELHIGGVQLARGYLGRPGLTAERFVPDPFTPGARLYRTGDLARRREDGAIEFLGRVDQQVKVHGVRVEPGEVEAALAGHPRVRRAVVTVRDDAPGGRGLVAYVDWAGDPSALTEELRGLLVKRLPAAMLPQAFVPVDSFPALPSGKLDRAALPSPAGRGGLGGEYVAPRTPIEEELCAIWRDLLGRDQVGVRDDFFDLGGHSLLAARLVARIRDAFGAEIPLRRCFELSTVEDYALVILEDLLAAEDGAGAPYDETGADGADE